MATIILILLIVVILLIVLTAMDSRAKADKDIIDMLVNLNRINREILSKLSKDKNV